MSEVISPLAYQVGLGGVVGFIAGYALKKLVKLALVIIGIFIIALVYLSYQGIISINFTALEQSVTGALGFTGQAAGWIGSIISYVPLAGAFGLAFFLGFKMG